MTSLAMLNLVMVIVPVRYRFVALVNRTLATEEINKLLFLRIKNDIFAILTKDQKQFLSEFIIVQCEYPRWPKFYSHELSNHMIKYGK